MQSYDCIIIGAGASGLACAVELSSKGKRVLVLEARERIGGRIFTTQSTQTSAPIELGAEFIHGKPASLLNYLDQRKIPYYDVHDSHVYTTTRHQDSVKFWERLEKFEKKMSVRKKDRSIQQFSEAHKADSKTKALFSGFIEGFHAADTDRISENYLAMARNEASDEAGLDKSFRIVNGFQQLMQDYVVTLQKNNTEISLNSEVTQIHWKKNAVQIETVKGQFQSKKVVITVPVGVLKSKKGEKGGIEFQPRPAKLDLLLSGFDTGHVIKIIFVFKNRFWEEKLKKDFSFLHAGPDHDFPTWWSMLPVRAPVLIAWQGGPEALHLYNQSGDECIRSALTTLSYILKIPVAVIQKQVVSSHVHNWTSDPYSRGAYSYVVVDGVPKVKQLLQPIEDTLYFSGEALASFPNVATVHGAIEAGQRTAKQILE